MNLQYQPTAFRATAVVAALTFVGVGLIQWGPTNHFMVANHGWALWLIAYAVIAAYVFRKVAVTIRRARETGGLICVYCGHNLCGSCVAACPKCGVAANVDRKLTTTSCRNCLAEFLTPSQFTCPECGISFRPEQARAFWRQVVQGLGCRPLKNENVP